MSSLATQLAQNVSLNASLLVDRSRRKASASYLFTGKEADQHDLEAIHALAVNALIQLSSISPALEKYEEALFSERAKETDRTLLTLEAIEELDKAIEEFLWLLSPYLMEPSTGKIIEWLVRRFRINEFNVEATLSLFLPYHESPHFAKIVTILQLKPNSTWSFLIPYKSAAQNLPRVSLVTEMLKNSDLARFVVSLLPAAVKKGLGHRVLFAFNAATLHDFIKRSKSMSEGTMAYLLPALIEPLQQKGKKLVKDGILGSYILLATLSSKCELSPTALKAIVGVMSTCAHTVQGNQFMSSLVAICEGQPELENFTDGTLSAMLRISDFKEALASSSSWVGSEKVIHPLVKILCDKLEDPVALDVLESIILTQTTPSSVFETLASSLLEVAAKSEGETQISLSSRQLLSLIQQRQPDILGSTLDTFSENNPSLKDTIEQLTIFLSTIGQLSNTTSRESNDMLLASADADAKVRTIAVKELIKSIEGKELTSIDDMETTRGILIARLQDSNAGVLEALYANPSAVTHIFVSDPKSFLSSLSVAMDSESKPKRNLLRLHLTYLASSFWKAVDPSVQKDIFHRIFFPFFLFSKPRQKTAELVWDIIKEHFSEDASLEWLTGCAQLVKLESNTEGAEAVDSMNVINFNVAERMAGNIMKSDHFTEHLETLISKLTDSHPHIKLMGYLVATALVKQLSGDRQVDVAHQILATMNLNELSGIDDSSQEHLALGSAEDKSLGKYIITKPSSKTTQSWTQIYLVAAMSRIPRPTDLVLDWVAESSSNDTDRQSRFVRLIRSIYQLANASTSIPVLSSSLLQILFVNLKGDALAFLAGIWSSGNADEYKDSKAISLLHAAAFLEAHLLEDDGLDFQTILPALLVALQTSDAHICQGALECISRVRILAERKLSSVYRFDAIYGHNDRTLQYLDQDDLKRYLTALVEHRDHFANDPSYLKTLNDQHLGRTKIDKKRDADYKHRIVCYLLSHINALSSETVQNALLKSIVTISNKAKIEILLPTIQAVVDNVSSVEATDTFSKYSEEFLTRLLSSYDSAAATYLNDTPSAWDNFSQLLQTFFRSGTPIQPQEALVHALENGLFASLNQQRKFSLCEILLDVGSQDSSSQSLSRRVLSTVLVDVPLIVHLLGLYTPAGPTSSPRAKRVKTTETPEDVLPRLSLLVEILGTKSLPGSLDLISHLLDTLSRIVQVLPPAQADVSYIEQLLMSAVESAASKITEVPNLSPSVIRLDILVEVIRVSGNSQTFHQALLLIANLARLAPESVLYNVMPVFTFMGSNVFHRDDTYSFKVVQQTIDGIVPVMVSSLKEAHTQPLDLYLASKEFLRVFSDAANHIPRHRRNKFFAHLVDVLGARDFLAPICMLLLEKMANRIIRQPSEEVQNSLSLPIAVFQHCDYALQLHTATEILQESRRIVTHIADPQSKQPIFLEGLTDGDHSISSSTILRRRAQALIVFVGYAFKPKTTTPALLHNEISISSVISQLITLAILPEGVSNETKIGDVSEAARSTLNRLLSGISVVDFSEAVQSMLDSGDVKVQSGALELLAKRLPEVSAKMRPTLSSSIVKILVSVKGLLTVHKDGPLVVHAFDAINSIASTISSGEESSLTDLVPLVISAAREKALALAALGALSAMSVKLGPRIIPFFRSIISLSITVLRGEDTALFQNSFEILSGLLSTIPTFWGSGEVNQVIFLYMDQTSSSSKTPSTALPALTKSLAKRIPAKVLIPTLLDMWQSLQVSGNLARISAYFHVFARALQHADRPIVLEHLRTSFKIFLEALDIVKVDIEVETRVISAFKELVVKLNETAFKPLFRRLYDWAFVENTNDIARKVTFGHLYISLLDFFKTLMVPYMSFLLQPYCDILASFTASTSSDFSLWSSILQTLTRTLNFDDGVFWRDDKLRQIATSLTGQIEVCIRLGFGADEGKTQLLDCLAALVENATDDTLLKSINLSVLMHTRSEDHRVRLFALTCAEAIWRANGGKLLAFVGETATFISECGEDENDVVVKECIKLKDAVESVAGAIDGL